MNVGFAKFLSRIARVLMVFVVFGLGVFWGKFLKMDMKPIPLNESHPTIADRGAHGLANLLASHLMAPELEGVAVSMVVLDEDGAVWFASPLAHTAMIPASALKVLTTGAAISELGPDFRFVTQFASSAAAGPVLDGDLVIIGRGDPTLSSARLREMAGELVKSGVRRIDGRVIMDASYFPDHPVSDHWNWGDVGHGYGAGAFGLNVDHNRMVVEFRRGHAIGDPAILVGGEVSLPDVEMINLVTTGRLGSDAVVDAYSAPYGRSLTFRGTVPVGVEGYSVRAAIPNPPVLAASIVRDALVAEGVEITGRERSSGVANEVLVASESKPLMEIVRSIHRSSDNLEAQCLFLAMDPQGDPAARVRDFWRGRGVDLAAFRMLDGSGLARANTIRAVDLAKVMHVILNSPYGEEFAESLPGYHEGVVRSKPGWMSGVQTSVGMIMTKDGRRLTYAFMANSVSDREAVFELRRALREEAMR